MLGPVADDHPFFGISKKLERADENIINLHNEIIRFFKGCKYPVIPKTHEQGWQEVVDYHRDLQIPKRFSVLAGETVHHLRSCLDHIVWHFSSTEARRDHASALEFPIFQAAPSKDELKRYKRKVQGITNLRVLALIEALQPYHRPDASDDILLIVHDMDRFDKHRELMIVTACANLTFPAGTRPETIANVVAYKKGKTLSMTEFAAAQRAIKNDAKVSPQVAFSNFGNREGQFVVPSLMALLNGVSDVAEMFAKEL